MLAVTTDLMLGVRLAGVWVVQWDLMKDMVMVAVSDAKLVVTMVLGSVMRLAGAWDIHLDLVKETAMAAALDATMA